MLQEDDLAPADKAILSLLREGRITAPYAAEQTDYSLQYIRDRLSRMVEHGNVRKITDGVYELVSDPDADAESGDYRERALQKYGHICDVCGSNKNIVVHHRDGDRTNNELENLVPLCEACHGKVHSKSDEVPDLVRELGYSPRDKEEETTIEISVDVWQYLTSKKERPGESFDDVLRRELGVGAADAAETASDGVDDGEARRGDDTHSDDADAITRVVNEVAAEWDDTPARTGERKMALKAVLEELRDRGEATTSELKGIEGEYPVENQSSRTWWRKTIRPGLKQVAEYDNSGKQYVWVGE